MGSQVLAIVPKGTANLRIVTLFASRAAGSSLGFLLQVGIHIGRSLSLRVSLLEGVEHADFGLGRAQDIASRTAGIVMHLQWCCCCAMDGGGSSERQRKATKGAQALVKIRGMATLGKDIETEEQERSMGRRLEILGSRSGGVASTLSFMAEKALLLVECNRMRDNKTQLQLVTPRGTLSTDPNEGLRIWLCEIKFV